MKMSTRVKPLYQTLRRFSSQASGSFLFADLDVTRTSTPGKLPPLESLQFGLSFSDHMFVAEHVEGQGWNTPTIRPFGPLALHPASQVLHYGMCCFEGMKAYSGADGRGRLFRPAVNMARLQRSQRRLALPDFEPAETLECLKELLRIDRAFLPAEEGYSLYIRPFMFSSAGTLGVGPATRTTLSIILSPVGAPAGCLNSNARTDRPYFRSGMQPVQLFVDEENVRAWPGGAGNHKVGGNYATTIQPQVQAREQHGASQVLFTWRRPGAPAEEAVFSESGSMNLFFFLENADGSRELVTPPLDGTILPGVTRESVIQLAAGWGEFAVTERQLTISEVEQAAKEDRLLEVFGTGTACIVQPVNLLKRGNGDEYVPRNADYPLGARIVKALADIQYGRTESPWSVPFEE